MAINKLYKFRRIDDVIPFLNGAIIGGTANMGYGPPSHHAPGIQGLVGTTLTFTSPSAAVVTFAPSSGSNPDPTVLLFSDIKAQIEAVLTTVRVTLNGDGQITITEKTPANGVAVSGGTANALLGFDQANGMTGKVYKPASVSNSPPCWTWAYSGNDNMHNVYTWE
jgi:hypothetical protein